MTTETKAIGTWSGVSTDLDSFNAFGVVTLSNGQNVNVQNTMRHGMKAEKMYEDFKEFVKFLDMAAQDSGVKFWDGSKGPTSSDTPQTGSKAPNVAGETKSFKATKILVLWDKGKQYFKVEGEPGKFPKFPVTIWPEVLEAYGVNYDAIDPKDGLTLDNVTAYYVVNEKNNPQKVVKLVAENPF